MVVRMSFDAYMSPIEILKCNNCGLVVNWYTRALYSKSQHRVYHVLTEKTVLTINLKNFEETYINPQKVPKDAKPFCQEGKPTICPVCRGIMESGIKTIIEPSEEELIKFAEALKKSKDPHLAKFKRMFLGK
jgi:hypothetical protein